MKIQGDIHVKGHMNVYYSPNIKFQINQNSVKYSPVDFKTFVRLFIKHARNPVHSIICKA